MSDPLPAPTPSQCPVCDAQLRVTRLRCGECGTEVAGVFYLGRLCTLREPHAGIIDLFLRVRGNVKEMERELGLSYPTVRARLEDALTAAGYWRNGKMPESNLDDERHQILDEMESGKIAAGEAAALLRELGQRRLP